MSQKGSAWPCPNACASPLSGYPSDEVERMNLLKRHWKLLVLLVVVFSGLGVFAAFGPPQLMALSESPLFCSSCHVMESEYEAWFHVGAHRSIRCVDCHLPHQNLPLHYIWKTIDGMKDVAVFYSGRVPETIEITERAQNVLRANCIRCHSERVALINQDRNCWECHRFLQHKLAGVRSTTE
jgi:cytochrome c nitrite reductase small subunit